MSEHDEQVAFFDWIELNLARLEPVKFNNCAAPSKNPELLKALNLCYALPNGGKRHLVVALKLKKEGVRHGFPDINIDYPVDSWHGLRIENKFGNNRLTKMQRLKKTLLESVGFKYVVCRSAGEAINTLINYLPFSRQDYVGV